ncbi:cupin domain-containing protein [Paenibacillus aurantius]|uniref:Cupin domain-containing protein n=1 Tax=Paenibacillus aurantius TaxID=2918900 RepID=A0AA96LFC2_9BACL|nr:cupin domain-containing protein [Paenibacillus aurantius]WNQ11071.1 cupin domain-containing protein [Paenibacillus aurantius]
MKTSRQTAEHYIWGETCDGWHLVKQPGMSVIQERMPPGTFEVRHYHGKARQFFYVLNGEAVLELDRTEYTLVGGEGLEVPPGTPHQMKNRSEAEVEFLVISSPSTAEDRHLTEK